ncbi:MAG: hypothetical protein LIP02_00730 [Bacteroidales bacterium]|nr:hypothetical protein [Bacteroidales bacterium]
MARRFTTGPIRSMIDLEERAAEAGFLPMFQSCVPGYSVYENTLRFWSDDDGPWEWKGPIIREGHLAYGKFFQRKAGYVSLEWLPDFLNYRRSKRLAPNEDLAALDEVVLQAIQSEGRVGIKELRQLLGFAKGRGKRRPQDLVDDYHVDDKISLDPILTRLQMEGRVCIADFTYNVDRRGNQYGWGEALYSTPETLYGNLRVTATPEESYARMLAHLCKLLPMASDTQIRKLLG